METLCPQPDAAKKIEEIATGVLRKNLRFVRQLEKIDKRDKEIIERMNHTQDQMKALEERVARDKVNIRYRVTVSDTLTNSQAASLIANAILFEPEAVQLVARSNGNNLEMEKDWELMSEFQRRTHSQENYSRIINCRDMFE